MAIAVYSQSTSPLGTSTYRFVGIDVPAMYVPTLTFDARKSSGGKNIWVKVDTEYPLLATVNDVQVVSSTFRIKTEFTALQNVVAATERERLFDEHVAFLTDNKAKILAGKVI